MGVWARVFWAVLLGLAVACSGQAAGVAPSLADGSAMLESMGTAPDGRGASGLGARLPRLGLPRWLGGRASVAAGGLDIPAGERQFALYYGWPSVVNGAAGDADAAAAIFAQYQVVIFGDGLQQPSHPDYPRTAAVLARLRELGRPRVFGYVDLGVRTQNLPLPALLQAAAAWQQLGASGIFLDDAGTDFDVDEARRDAAVEGVHRLGLRVILNAHAPEDAFRGRVKLGPGDGYLFESFLVSDGHLQPADTALAKADRVLELALPTGADVYAVATGPADDPGFAARYAYAWWGVLLYGFPYFQYTTIDYGANNPRLDYQPRDVPDLGTRYLDERVQHDWAQGLHQRRTDRGVVRLMTGAATAGAFVPGAPP